MRWMTSGAIFACPYATANERGSRGISRPSPPSVGVVAVVGVAVVVVAAGERWPPRQWRRGRGTTHVAAARAARWGVPDIASNHITGSRLI